MATPELYRRIAKLRFGDNNTEELTNEEIAKQLYKDGVLTSPDNTKRVRQLIKEAVWWMLSRTEPIANPVEILVFQRDARDNHHAACLRNTYPHLHTVIAVSGEEWGGSAYGYSDDYDNGVVLNAARLYLNRVLDSADDYQDTIKLLVGGGHDIFKIMALADMFVPDKRSRPNVSFYPAAILGHSRQSMYSPPGPDVNAIAGWLACGAHAGRLRYVTVPPPEPSAYDVKLVEHAKELTSYSHVQDHMKKYMNRANAVISVIGAMRTIDHSYNHGEPNLSTFTTVADFLHNDYWHAEASISASGAVGEFAYCFFDEQGNPAPDTNFFVTPNYPNGIQFYRHLVEEGLSSIGIGLRGDTLAIRSALRGKFINVLITDHRTAHELDLSSKTPDERIHFIL